MEKITFTNYYDERRRLKFSERRDRKAYSDIYKEARERAKPTKCLICGKELNSFCNSHSLPKFVLKQIADNGKILTGHAFSSHPINDEFGVNNALTFQLICDECDIHIFKNMKHLRFLRTE